MKKLVMILMLTAFAAPAQASMLVSLPSMVLAPFGGPCTDCNMGVQTSLMSNPQSSGWLTNLLGPSASQAVCSADQWLFEQGYRNANQPAVAATLGVNCQNTTSQFQMLSNIAKVRADSRRAGVNNLR